VLHDGIRQVLAPSRRPQRWLEIGAGDATLLARLAPRLARHWPDVELTLVDQQPCVSPCSLARMTAQGWRVRQSVGDVFDVLDVAGSRYDLVLANLVLHHFEREPLERLLRLIARTTGAFVACEPRRSRVALLGSHLVGVLGANRVTRQDAVLSVHAGFTGTELSALWPRDGWQLTESAAFPFTHRFVARVDPRAGDAL
jgi:SAM-dependent methyltransferase